MRYHVLKSIELGITLDLVATELRDTGAFGIIVFLFIAAPFQSAVLLVDVPGTSTDLVIEPCQRLRIETALLNLGVDTSSRLAAVVHGQDVTQLKQVEDDGVRQYNEAKWHPAEQVSNLCEKAVSRRYDRIERLEVHNREQQGLEDEELRQEVDVLNPEQKLGKVHRHRQHAALKW